MKEWLYQLGRDHNASLRHTRSATHKKQNTAVKIGSSWLDSRSGLRLKGKSTGESVKTERPTLVALEDSAEYKQKVFVGIETLNLSRIREGKLLKTL